MSAWFVLFVVSSVVGALDLSPDMALIIGNKSGLEFHQLISLVFISGSVLIDYGLDLDLISFFFQLGIDTKVHYVLTQ